MVPGNRAAGLLPLGADVDITLRLQCGVEIGLKVGLGRAPGVVPLEHLGRGISRTPVSIATRPESSPYRPEAL